LKNCHGAVSGLFVTYYVVSDECAQLVDRYSEDVRGFGFRILSFDCFRWRHGLGASLLHITVMSVDCVVILPNRAECLVRGRVRLTDPNRLGTKNLACSFT
jgi:hypothetical protein